MASDKLEGRLAAQELAFVIAPGVDQETAGAGFHTLRPAKRSKP